MSCGQILFLCLFVESEQTKTHDERLFQEVEIQREKESFAREEKKGEKAAPFRLFVSNDESTDGIFSTAD